MRAVLLALLCVTQAAACSDAGSRARDAAAGACPCANGGCCTAAGACVPDGAACGAGGICTAGTCLPGGGEGRPCRYESPACDDGLACVDAEECVAASPHEAPEREPYRCATVARGGEGEACFEDGTCAAGLFCGRSAERCAGRCDDRCCVVTAACSVIGAPCEGFAADYSCAEPTPATCPDPQAPCCLPFTDGVNRPCTGDADCGPDGRCLGATAALSCPYGMAACCVPAGDEGTPCFRSGQCHAGLMCLPRSPGECAHGLDWCCSLGTPCATGACPGGMTCIAAGEACPYPAAFHKCCFPAGEIHEACGEGCAAGLGCLYWSVGLETWCASSVNGKCCLPAGAEGQPCATGQPTSCEPGLTCVPASPEVCPDYPEATECCTAAG